MNYTKEDYIVLEKALKDMRNLMGYFEHLIAKLEIQCKLFDESKKLILDRVYDVVRHQNCFDVNSWEDDVYIDIAYDNLVLSVYAKDDGTCVVGEEFEIWNDSDCCCLGTLSISQVENILRNKGE